MSPGLLSFIAVVPFAAAFFALWSYTLYGFLTLPLYGPDEFRPKRRPPGWDKYKVAEDRFRLGVEWLFQGKHGHEKYRRNLLRVLIALGLSIVWMLAVFLLMRALGLSPKASAGAASLVLAFPGHRHRAPLGEGQ